MSQTSWHCSSSDSLDAGHDALILKGGNNPTLFSSILSSSKFEYLATLYSALYASEDPFNDFAKALSRFLKVSRKAFEHVWPHLRIMLHRDDTLFNIVSLSINHCYQTGLNLILRAINMSLKNEARSMTQLKHLYRTTSYPK